MEASIFILFSIWGSLRGDVASSPEAVFGVFVLVKPLAVVQKRKRLHDHQVGACNLPNR